MARVKRVVVPEYPYYVVKWKVRSADILRIITLQ